MSQIDTHTSLSAEEQHIRQVLEKIYDPEIPVLSVTDLGIIRQIIVNREGNPGDRSVEILITPTYSGCPAMDVITGNIRFTLGQEGFSAVKVTTVLSPAWTTEWMSAAGKEKLKAYGIAPPNPVQQVCNAQFFMPHEGVQCPHCNSWHTRRIREFGSTPCKALYRCDDCSEPFDYFKCH
jgi:ring-1,2-phenylacetyl-CoA epoxidase subunit PaaD